MKKALGCAVRALGRLRGLFPMALPRGPQEWERFCWFVLAAYGFPISREYQLSLANMIMHQGERQVRVRPLKLAQMIRTQQAKQTAYALIDAERAAQKAIIDKIKKEEADRKAAESGNGAATTPKP